MLIADHARQDAPPNSFSWRFIEESVKEGRRLDLETYRIGRPPSKPRPVASMEPSRNHRTPFSLADDVLLAAWVANNEKSGGNKLYQRLEVVVSLALFPGAFCSAPRLILSCSILITHGSHGVTDG